jgi:hypothetical protein
MRRYTAAESLRWDGRALEKVVVALQDGTAMLVSDADAYLEVKSPAHEWRVLVSLESDVGLRVGMQLRLATSDGRTGDAVVSSSRAEGDRSVYALEGIGSLPQSPTEQARQPDAP